MMLYVVLLDQFFPFDYVIYTICQIQFFRGFLVVLCCWSLYFCVMNLFELKLNLYLS